MSDWIKTFLFVGPIVAACYAQCQRAGMNPTLPIIGLVVGIVLEMQDFSG